MNRASTSAVLAFGHNRCTLHQPSQYYEKPLVLRSFASAATPSVKERADSLIKEHSCVVFGKTTCGFCSMAINILQKENAKFHIFMMDKELPFNEVDDMQDYMKSITGGRSVPRVFIGGKFIGGGDDTLELHERGDLKGLL